MHYTTFHTNSTQKKLTGLHDLHGVLLFVLDRLDTEDGAEMSLRLLEVSP